MQKDFKVGMMVGMAVLLGAVVWLSTRQGIGNQARLERRHAEWLAHPAEGPEVSAGTPSPLPRKQPAQKSQQESSPEPKPRQSSQHQAPALTLPTSTELSPLRNTKNEARQKIKTNTLVIVRAGDTLSGIAQEHLGSSQHWPRLLKFNRDVLSHPDKIRPGMKIIVPGE